MYMDKVVRSEEKILIPDETKIKVGVDLGTAYIVIVVLDENDNPVACIKEPANVVRDGVVVDFVNASKIVGELKGKLESRLGFELKECAIAMPSGTESSTKTHIYVAESAGFEVINVLDEPTAANAVFNISNGVIIDIGGGTTGLAILKNGQVVSLADEATGGIHLSLVLAGNLNIPFDEAEKMKMDEQNHKKIFPIIRPVIEKMASIVEKYIDKTQTDILYLCGGTCCMTGIEEIFEKQIGIPVIKPNNPFLITPTGIAKSCIIHDGKDNALCN